MLKLKNTFLAVFAALVLFAGCSAVNAGGPTAGSPAPNFTASDNNGKCHSLSDFKGKFVVLEWYNPECPFVKAHYDNGAMQKLQKAYTQKGVVWLLVNSSADGKQGHLTKATANPTLKAKGANATALLFDHDGKIGKLYGAKTTPHMYVIDPRGNLIYSGAIDDAQSDKKGVNYVQAALDAAMGGKPVAVATTRSYGCSVKYAD